MGESHHYLEKEAIVALFGPSTFIAFLSIALFSGCSEERTESGAAAVQDQLTAAQWRAVMQKRVYFGHQSVGENILSGVKSLSGEAGVSLPVLETADPVSENGIVHFRIGKNGDPLSKMNDFARVMENIAEQGADVALMKLCYIDFNSNTDAKAVAKEYCALLDRMSRRHPQTKFVAVTVPLTVVQTGPKAWIKRLLGKPPAGVPENQRRQEFNNVLRTVYGSKGEIFDLARLESGSDSARKGTLEALNPDLSSDGGHLNLRGQRLLAGSLLKAIAGIPAEPR